MEKHNGFNQNYFCDLFAEYLIEQGFIRFVFSPGARNSPLVLALLQKESIDNTISVFSHFDERGSGFFALGLAKAIGNMSKKVVLITTSGSAVGNLLPALIEANNNQASLLIITADRPRELHDLGNNQTIKQNILTSQLSHELELDPWLIITTINKCNQKMYNLIWGRIQVAIEKLNFGSVQLNLIFREPFNEKSLPINKNLCFKHWKITNSLINIDHLALNIILNQVDCGRKEILIVGSLDQLIDKKAIEKLILQFSKLGWLVIIDILSGITVPIECQPLLHYDNWFKWAMGKEKGKKVFYGVDTIIHLGGRIVSKWWLNWLVNNEIRNYIHINFDDKRYDPAEVVTSYYNFPLEEFSRSFLSLLTGLKKEKSKAWIKLKKINLKYLKFKENFHFNFFCEPLLMRSLNHVIQSKLNANRKIGVFLGNSRPIRDFADGYFPINANPNLYLFASRGASGIDGQVATAIGISVGISIRLDSFYCILGDLTLLHDLNSLALLKTTFDLANSKKTIKKLINFIVINNQEGTIFNFLPLRKMNNTKSGKKKINKLEKIQSKFLYRHNYNFHDISQMFGIDYVLVKNVNQLNEALVHSIKNHQLIEIKINSKENLIEHKNYQKKMDGFFSNSC